MKHFALGVSATGDAWERTIIAYAVFSDAMLNALKELRSALGNVPSSPVLGSSLAYIAMYTNHVEWLNFDACDESWEHYEAIASDEVELHLEEFDGVFDLKQEVYERHLKLFHEVDSDGEAYVLRTELDRIHISTEGVQFVCEEEHADAIYQTSLINWELLFAEQPQESDQKS